MNYEQTARRLEAAAKQVRARGQATEQRFYDWQKVERIEGDQRGGGNGGASWAVDVEARADDRKASRFLRQWRDVMSRLESDALRVSSLVEVAHPVLPPRLSHQTNRTTEQVVADGWCGSHWRIGELVAISCRPSGEPYYRGKCRRCGDWPGGVPPIEVLQTWRDGRSLKVAAS